MKTYLQYVCRLGRVDIVLAYYANGQFSPSELAEPTTLDAMLVPASLFVILECLIMAQTGAMGEIAATHVCICICMCICVHQFFARVIHLYIHFACSQLFPFTLQKATN